MAPHRSRPHRLLLPVILAAVLAAEVTGFAIARSAAVSGPAAHVEPGPIVANAVQSAAAGAGTGAPGGADPDARRSPRAPEAGERVLPSGANLRHPAPALAATTRSTTASVKSGSASTKPASSGSGHHAAAQSFHGRNHVWIPSLRISKSIQSFPCSRAQPPGAGVYRWGCAGRNNVYLLSHAWSTFKPLHDAYVNGRLRKGMQVWYADGSGRVRQFRVIWWRVTAPTTAASWAWAPQSRPSMTLQTCVGARSQYRLMVRLVQAG